MRIAIVGSGIAGLTCAHVLGPHHEVVLFEADRRLGGHANTVIVDDPVAGALGIDTGFIVHNDRNYPNLCRLLDDLGITTVDTEMSFAVTDRRRDLTYRATSLNTLFADRRNLVRPVIWQMVADIVRFHRNARRFLTARTVRNDTSIGPSIAEFLADGHYSEAFVDLHLIPMGAAVWSADPTTFDRFPAASLLQFLDNHGLLAMRNRPQWRAIAGGSRTYVEEIASRFRGQIRLGTAVEAISHDPDGAVSVRAGGRHELFDRVILACHSDQALDLLVDATPAEKEILGAVVYQPNTATLHTDISLLPPSERAWAAWNYECTPGTRASLTYDLTTLQRLEGSRRYLVTLNAEHAGPAIDPDTILARFDYAHPVFDASAVAAQGRLAEIDGVAGVHFCGAWTGYGFHEDGMVSGVRVCRDLGVDW